MASRKAGDLWIAVHPDSSMFGTRAREQVRRETAGIKVDVPVTADTKSAVASVEALKTRMLALNENLAKLRLTADGKPAEAAIAKVQAKMAVLAKTVARVTMSADTKKLDAQILAKIADLKRLQQGMSRLKMDADDKALTAKILALEKQLLHLRIAAGKMKIDADKRAAEAKINSLAADITLLRHNAKDITLVASNVAALRNVALLKAEIASLQKQARDIRLGGNIDAAGLMAAEATLLGLEGAFGKVSEESALAKTAMNAFFATTGKSSTFAAAGWKLLTGHITLFGGALNQVLPRMFTSVAVWHLLADAVIELVAVWAPAILAVTAFGVAGADAAKSIFQRMQAVHTVMDATGKAVPPLTDSFKHLAAAVKPEVYQLFGDALVIMGKRGGAFNTVATETGRVIDQLAARFVVAVTSGTGVNKFMENAVTDVRLLGDSIGNLGGIFGAVFRAVPGYAEILLQVGDAITKVLETATQAAEPVIAVGLALHGFFIYGGAAVTVSLALVASLVKVGAAFGKFNEKILLVGLGNLNKFRNAMITAGTGIAGYAGELLAMAGAQGKAAAGTKVLADAQRLLTKIPTTVWVIAAATALASLVFAIARSKDAAQKFNATLQETITNAPLANVITTIQQAQVVTAARLADSTRKLNTAIKENTVVNAGRAGALNSNGTAIQNLDNASRHYAQGLGQLTDQQKLVTGRFGDLSKAYGGNTAALGILNAAGITTAQITDTNKDHWAQALIQVEATAKAYAAMGTQAGVLGNDLDVLGRTVTDQAQAVKKLNDAWSQFIGDVTGTQGAFDTVAQGFFTLQDHAGKLTFSLGKLKIKYADQKAAIDSLTPAGIALNQAFGEQVVNIDKLFASWRTAGLASGLFTAGVKDAIGPLVKYATGSKEATAQLVALAQEAGYQGPISMQALTKWLGNTHGATQKLKDITNQATAQEALLTGAMQAQGNFIADKLIGDIRNAVLGYSGVEAAVKAYGTALAKTGKGSEAANKAMTSAVAGLVKSGLAMGSNAQQIGAIVAKTFGISMPAAMKLVQNAMAAMVAGLPPAQKKFEQFAISGLGLTRSEADKLWKKFAETNLGALAGKADTTRDKFGKLASKGLGITRDQADLLWKHLRMQYLDTLATKGDITRGKFEKLAMAGLGVTRDQADKLWNKLREQYLDRVGSKADTTRAQFEKLAGKLGYSKDQADKLWGSLHRLTASGYSVNVKVNAQGYVDVNGYKISAGAYFSPHAEGGFISGGTTGKDSVPAMLMPGEVVVPTKMVKQGAVDHLRGSLPGFAAGGAVRHPRTGIPGYAYGGKVPAGSKVGDTGDLTTNMPMQSLDAIGGFLKNSSARIAAAATKALFKWAMNSLGGKGGAIVSYARSFLGKIPYVFGGNSLSGGIDCSGFTQAVYSKFGINAPRTSEAQYAWATKSGPVPGGLAFYVSPAGGPPPGHVAIVQSANSVISQGGGMGPKIESLKFLPLMGTGVPKGGFPKSAGGGGNQAIGGGATPGTMSAGAIAALWRSDGGPGYAAANMARIAYAESGDRPGAIQKGQPPGLTGWGLYQITPTSGIWQNGRFGNLLNASNNTRAAISLFNVSGYSPWTTAAALGLGYQGPHAQGGLIRKMAGGGQVPGYANGTASAAPGWGVVGENGPELVRFGGGEQVIPGMAAGGTVAGLRSTLAREQAAERAKYYGLGHAFATGPAKYRTKTVMGELATLAARQAAEQQAYSALAGSGLTTTRLHHLGATARAERIVAADKGLSKMPGGHPGWAADLRKYLGQISTTASGSVPAGSLTGGGGGSTKPPSGSAAKQGAAYLRAWQTRHGGGFGAAWAPKVLNQQIAAMSAALSRATTLSKASGLSAGQHKFWANAAADEKKRLAVLKKELSVERSWRYQLQLHELVLDKQIRAAGTIKSLAGPVKGWKSQLAHDKSVVAQISKMLGYSDAYIAAHPAAKPKPGPAGPPKSPVDVRHTYGGDVGVFDAIAPVLAKALAPFAKGGLAGFTRGGMASFDRGGVLSPGANTVWNGTGRDEKLVPAGSNVTVTLEIAPGGNTAFEQLLHSAIRKHVKVRGGGSVQRAYSVPGTVSGANTWRSG